MSFHHLMPECNARNICVTCQEPVRQDSFGRWYITMHHAGFNSHENNRNGYPTKEEAVKAYKTFRGSK